MFQRVFNTTDIGVTLENDYKTNNELSYNIKLDDKSTFTSATLNLYDENNNLVDSLKFNNENCFFPKDIVSIENKPNLYVFFHNVFSFVIIIILIIINVNLSDFKVNKLYKNVVKNIIISLVIVKYIPSNP